MGSRGKARAKEAPKENATTVEPPGISQKSAFALTKARVKAKASKQNASIAEKWAIQPASAPRTKEPGAREDAKELGAKEDSKEKAE